MYKQLRGFTIVELLVVIVVIAILAAITLMSYNSIQRRAHNVVTINAAQNAVKLITSYYTLNGPIHITDLPSAARDLCIGHAADYPAVNGLHAKECYPGLYTSAQLEDALDSIGVMSLKTYAFNDGEGNYTRGVQYTIDGDAFLWFDLIGADQDCELANSSSPGGGPNETDCRVNMTELLGEAPITY